MVDPNVIILFKFIDNCDYHQCEMFAQKGSLPTKAASNHDN